MLPRPYRPSEPKDPDVARLERSVRDFTVELRDKVLNGGLETSNLRGQSIVQRGVVAPGAGVDLSLLLPLGPSFTAPPQAVTLRAAEEDTGDVLAGLAMRWRPGTAGQYQAVLLVRVDGLTPGRTYTLRLHVAPQE